MLCLDQTPSVNSHTRNPLLCSLFMKSTHPSPAVCMLSHAVALNVGGVVFFPEFKDYTVIQLLVCAEQWFLKGAPALTMDLLGSDWFAQDSRVNVITVHLALFWLAVSDSWEVCVDRAVGRSILKRRGDRKHYPADRGWLCVCVCTVAAWSLWQAVSLAFLSPSDRWQHYIRPLMTQTTVAEARPQHIKCLMYLWSWFNKK